ncbi:MAG: prepilin peptidase [Candidatus Thorarchaeota archaeon]|nr:prepilin peptidase [Candidatus Thorarchaeota archaeon]
MTFEATITSTISFIVMSVFLLVFGILDAREQRVPNSYTLMGIAIGAAIVTATGRFFEQPTLHVTAILVMILLPLVLYRIGAIGGADAKALLLIAILSPGIEFATWPDLILEGILISGLEIAIMLFLGVLYWQLRAAEQRERSAVPLIPFLLVAYLVVQLFAFL